MNKIAGASVSVVVPHARAGALTDALENDTRGSVSLAGGGDCRSPGGALPIYPATERGVTAGDRSPRTAQAPNSCANSTPAVPSRRGIFGGAPCH